MIKDNKLNLKKLEDLEKQVFKLKEDYSIEASKRLDILNYLINLFKGLYAKLNLDLTAVDYDGDYKYIRFKEIEIYLKLHEFLIK